MAKLGYMEGVLACVMLVAAMVPAPALATVDCSNMTTALTYCLAYVQGSDATPSATCCSELAAVSDTECLCELFNASFIAQIAIVNASLAQQLPAACDQPNAPNSSTCASLATTPVPTNSTAYSPVSAPAPAGDSPAATKNSSPSTTTSAQTSSSSAGVGIGIGVAVSGIVVLAVIVLGVCWRRRRWKKTSTSKDIGQNFSESRNGDGGTAVNVGNISSSQLGPQRFNLDQLSRATNNFSDAELLGRGGFGPVYRGVLPGDGTDVVAIKSIAENSRQGIKEFKAELSIISDLRHRNLVRLRGWCYEEGRFLLVYEYMGNGSLDYLLFNDELCGKLLWNRRYAIAAGLGSALLYLHEECDNVIIHRDVKCSNVLLDDNFNAKLGDFGLSRQVDQGITSHTTILAGTQGYMGPELFISSGRATRESDVYAYGAVLLELVTGKRILDISLQEHDGRLLHWVWDLFGQGRLVDVVDKRIVGNMSERDLEEAKRVLVVALACCHPEPKVRLKIRRAVEALNGTVALPPVPLSRPTASYGPLPTAAFDIYDTGISSGDDHSKPVSMATDSTAFSSTTAPSSSGSYV